MRKTVIFLLCVLFMAASAAFAQIDVGIMGGANFTTNVIKPDPGFEEKYRTEYGIGLFANMPVYKAFSVQFQPVYLRKGTDLGISGFDEDIRIAAQYLEFPILARYTFGSGMVRPYYFVGPSFGYLLNAEHTASFIPSAQEDTKDQVKSYEISLCFGGGVQVALKKASFFVQLTRMHGFTNADDVEAGDHSESIYGRGLSLMAGFSIPIGKKQ
jgi:hypothetical protein